MTPFLAYEQRGAVVTLTLSSPATRNVLTGNTATQEFVDACARINADESVRASVDRRPAAQQRFFAKDPGRGAPEWRAKWVQPWVEYGSSRNR